MKVDSYLKRRKSSKRTTFSPPTLRMQQAQSDDRDKQKALSCSAYILRTGASHSSLVSASAVHSRSLSLVYRRQCTRIQQLKSSTTSSEHRRNTGVQYVRWRSIVQEPRALLEPITVLWSSTAAPHQLNDCLALLASLVDLQ